MTTLTGTKIANTYKQLLQVGTGNVGLTSSLQTVQDGDASNSPLQLSNSTVNINGTFQLSGVTLTASASTLNAVADLTGATGIVAVSAGNVYGRTLVAGTGITIGNADGTEGNPTIAMVTATTSGSYKGPNNIEVNAVGQIVSISPAVSVSVATIKSAAFEGGTFVGSSGGFETNVSMGGDLTVNGNATLQRIVVSAVNLTRLSATSGEFSGTVSAGFFVGDGRFLVNVPSESQGTMRKLTSGTGINLTIDGVVSTTIATSGTVNLNANQSFGIVSATNIDADELLMAGVSAANVTEVAAVSVLTAVNLAAITSINAIIGDGGNYATSAELAATSVALATSIGNSNTNIAAVSALTSVNLAAVTSINSIIGDGTGFVTDAELAATSVALATSIGNSNTRITSVSNFAVALSATLAASIGNSNTNITTNINAITSINAIIGDGGNYATSAELAATSLALATSIGNSNTRITSVSNFAVALSATLAASIGNSNTNITTNINAITSINAIIGDGGNYATSAELAATSVALATSISNSNTNITTNINAITSINAIIGDGGNYATSAELAATSVALATSIGNSNTRITSVSNFAVALSATLATSIGNSNTRITSVSNFAVALSATLATSIGNSNTNITTNINAITSINAIIGDGGNYATSAELAATSIALATSIGNSNTNITTNINAITSINSIIGDGTGFVTDAELAATSVALATSIGNSNTNITTNVNAITSVNAVINNLDFATSAELAAVSVLTSINLAAITSINTVIGDGTGFATDAELAATSVALATSIGNSNTRITSVSNFAVTLSATMATSINNSNTNITTNINAITSINAIIGDGGNYATSATLAATSLALATSIGNSNTNIFAVSALTSVNLAAITSINSVIGDGTGFVTDAELAATSVALATSIGNSNTRITSVSNFAVALSATLATSISNSNTNITTNINAITSINSVIGDGSGFVTDAELAATSVALATSIGNSNTNITTNVNAITSVNAVINNLDFATSAELAAVSVALATSIGNSNTNITTNTNAITSINSVIGDGTGFATDAELAAVSATMATSISNSNTNIAAVSVLTSVNSAAITSINSVIGDGTGFATDAELAATSVALATSIGNSNTNIFAVSALTSVNAAAITSINAIIGDGGNYATSATLAATSLALATSIGNSNTRITSVSNFAVALSATMATSIGNSNTNITTNINAITSINSVLGDGSGFATDAELAATSVALATSISNSNTNIFAVSVLTSVNSAAITSINSVIGDGTGFATDAELAATSVALATSIGNSNTRITSVSNFAVALSATMATSINNSNTNITTNINAITSINSVIGDGSGFATDAELAATSVALATSIGNSNTNIAAVSVLTSVNAAAITSVSNFAVALSATMATSIGNSNTTIAAVSVLTSVNLAAITSITALNTQDVTLAGTPDYISIINQVITRNQIDLAADVTGNLPVTNLNAGTDASGSTFWRGDGVWTTPAGSGDVVGPASSTDNAITRFDSTTGKLLQNSTATLSDTGDITATSLNGILGSGTPAAATVTTLTASGVTTHGGDVVSDADSTDSLGTTLVRWANTWTDTINGVTAPTAQYTSAEETKLAGIETAADVTDATNVLAALVGQEAVATGFTGTLDGVLGGGTPAAATVTTLTASGVTTVQAGTALLPSIVPTGDTNTGVWFPAADTVAASTAGSERMRIDSSGNVGIGTSSPNSKLNVNGRVFAAGSFTSNNGDTDFNAGGSRAFMDWNGSLARIGTLVGGGSGGPVAFFVNGSESARIDTSGRLLVGTSTVPSNKNTVTPTLAVSGSGVNGAAQITRHTSVGGGGALLELSATRGTSNTDYTILQSGDGIGTVDFLGADGNEFVVAAQITAAVDGTPGDNDMPGRLVFSTTADGASSPTERLRITSAGNVGIGTTAPGAKLEVSGTTILDGGALVGSGSPRISGSFNGSTNWYFNTNDTAGQSGGRHHTFFSNGVEVGRITTTTSATTYTTSSDYRLKENINYDWDATTRLKQLKPARFNFKINAASEIVDGFLAHEVSSVVPEAIVGEKDAVNEDGDPLLQAIDQSKLVPLLVKAMQEQQATIEALTARITALEG
jgi:hypothetical protein